MESHPLTSFHFRAIYALAPGPNSSSGSLISCICNERTMEYIRLDDKTIHAKKNKKKQRGYCVTALRLAFPSYLFGGYEWWWSWKMLHKAIFGVPEKSLQWSKGGVEDRNIWSGYRSDHDHLQEGEGTTPSPDNLIWYMTSHICWNISKDSQWTSK